RTTPRASRLAGYLFALAAGAIWGTTGPLSTALYRAGEAITGIGFWRLVIGLLGFVVYGLFRPQLFRIDRKAWLLVGLGGGALVALFEVAYQFGVAGGLLAMLSFAGTTLLARYAVPRYGAIQVLFLEILGGIVVLGIVLPPTGHTPLPPHTMAAWMYVLLLSLGSVLAANFFFFAAVRRIDAALTSVAATIEPVVGALLALLLFKQELSPLRWLGLSMVVGGVATSYLSEAKTEE